MTSHFIGLNDICQSFSHCWSLSRSSCILVILIDNNNIVVHILVKLIVGQRVVTFLSMFAPQSGLSDEVKDLFFDQLRAVTARIRISDPMWRLEWPSGLCRHWIQGSAWWDGVWQAGTRCWGWENPRVCPSIWPASWEHMFQETWQPAHQVQVGKHNNADRLRPFP